MAEPTADDRKKWDTFEYGHLKAIKELNIDTAKLPKDIVDSIRGFKLGLPKIVNDNGFQKLVTLGAEIGDRIVTWHEKDAAGTEEEEKARLEKEANEKAAKEKEEADEAERLRVLNQHSSPEEKEKQRLADEAARRKKEEEEDDDEDYGLTY